MRYWPGPRMPPQVGTLALWVTWYRSDGRRGQGGEYQRCVDGRAASVRCLEVVWSLLRGEGQQCGSTRPTQHSMFATKLETEIWLSGSCCRFIAEWACLSMDSEKMEQMSPKLAQMSQNVKCEMRNVKWNESQNAWKFTKSCHPS